MQALILSIVLCCDDYLTIGQRCYGEKNLLDNDKSKGFVTQFYVNGSMYNVGKVTLLDTGILTIDKTGELSFAPYSGFKGHITLRYFVGNDWAYAYIHVVEMAPVLDENYCYILTKGNTKTYYLLVRQRYLKTEYYYYDTGVLLFPISYQEWRYWYKQKIRL